MSKKCPLCGGVAVLSGKNFLDEDVYECTVCHEPGHHSRFKEQTVFDHITESMETLAEEFVDTLYDRVACEYRYYSMLTAEFYDNRAEAIAATVEELKKEYKNEN